MKKIVLAFCLLWAFQEVSANHIAGGEITYESIATAAQPHLYKVKMTLYRNNEPGKPAFASSLSMLVSSSCFANQSFTVARMAPPASLAAGDGGFILQRAFQCIDTNLANLSTFSAHRYEGTVNLPGTCTDFRFLYSTCCRQSGITNIVNPGTSNLYLTAFLNNSRSENNSPVFKEDPLVNVCLGSDVLLNHNTDEKDGDSLTYLFLYPQTGAGSFAAYAPGYSLSNPVTTQSGVAGGLRFGVFSFRPVQVEKDVIVTSVVELRYDPIIQIYYQIGEVKREMLLNVVGSCDTSAPERLFRAGPLNLDTSSVTFCDSNLIKLKLNQEIIADSLDPVGSDFSVVGLGNNVIKPIVKARAMNRTYGDLYTREIWIELLKPFTYNETLSLSFKPGNGVVNPCGKPILRDSVRIAVTGCSTAFGLNEGNYMPLVKAYPNPVADLLTITTKWKNGPPTEVTVQDISGRTVSRETLDANPSGNFQVDCTNLNPGLYFIKTSTHEGYSETLSIIKN